MTRNGRIHAAIRTLLRVAVLISPLHHRDLHAAHDLEKPGIVAQHTAYARTHKKEKGEQGQGAMQVSTAAYKAEMRPGCLISRKRKKVHILFLACFCSKVYDILAFLLPFFSLLPRSPFYSHRITSQTVLGAPFYTSSVRNAFIPVYVYVFAFFFFFFHVFSATISHLSTRERMWESAKS